MRDVVVAVERALPDGGDGRTLIGVGDIDLGFRLLADARDGIAAVAVAREFEPIAHLRSAAAGAGHVDEIMPERFDVLLLFGITARAGALFEAGLRTSRRIYLRPCAVLVADGAEGRLVFQPAAGARLLLLAVLRAGRRNDDLPCAEIMPERRSGDGREHLLRRLVRKVLAALRTRPIFDGTRLGARRRDRIVMGEDVLFLLFARGKHAERRHGGSSKREQT